MNGEISDAAFTSSTLCLLINGEIHYCLETRRLREAVRASKELLSQLYQWGCVARLSKHALARE